MQVLVISHQRSGTHFLIDSILNNFEGSEFPQMRPSFSTLENLFLPHDVAVTEAFHRYTFSGQDDTSIKIFKTHLLPEEIEMGLNDKSFFPDARDREVVAHIYQNIPKLHVTRDVYDTLISLYHYEQAGGAIHNAMAERVQERVVEEFIRSVNYHIMPCRGRIAADKNKVTYLAHHNEAWRNKGVFEVTYQQLKEDFAGTLDRMEKQFGWNDYRKSQLIQPKILRPSKTVGGELVCKIQRRVFGFFNIRTTTIKPRLGKSGDHKQYFSNEDYDFIDQAVKSVQDHNIKTVKESCHEA